MAAKSHKGACLHAQVQRAYATNSVDEIAAVTVEGSACLVAQGNAVHLLILHPPPVCGPDQLAAGAWRPSWSPLARHHFPSLNYLRAWHSSSVSLVNNNLPSCVS